MPLVVLVTETGARIAVNVSKPGLVVNYRTGGKVTAFELATIDHSLRLIYRQRQEQSGDTPSAEGPAAS